MSGVFYVAVVQHFFILMAQLWVVKPRILKAFESLHNQATHRIFGRVPWRQSNGRWVYPHIVASLAGSVLGPVRDYITHQQNTLAQYILTQLIYNITGAEERISGSLELLRWCYQAGILLREIQGEYDELDLTMAEQINISIIQ